MKNIPEVGKAYTDKLGFTVTVTAVTRSGGGKAYGGDTRKGKLTGHTVSAERNGVSYNFGGQAFERRFM
jgi:hypothetical protein